MKWFGNDIVFAKDHRTPKEASKRSLGHPIRRAANGKRVRIKSGPMK